MNDMPRNNWFAGLAAVVRFFAAVHMTNHAEDAPAPCTAEVQP